MKIAEIRDLHADGGLKTFSFLKITTDDGRVGWSEYSEFIGSQGLGGVVRALAPQLIGHDPRDTAGIAALLQARTRVAAGGLNAQAAAALENACLDLKAKAYGVPVHQLFGGALRTRLPTYWSHCGTYRVRAAALLGRPPLRHLDDLEALGREVRDSGHRALKTNVLLFEGGSGRTYMPGFGQGPGHPELNLEPELLDALVAQIAALRRGAGAQVAIALDLNFNFKPTGLRRIARALEPFDLAWLETDLPDPRSMAALRQQASMPLASLEAVTHRRAALPYFEHAALDYAIIDVMWTGLSEAVKIAALADTFDVNVNSHAFSSALGILMGAQLCALAPNAHRVELDVDRVPWHDRLFSHPLQIERGELLLPDRPGWGIDVDEAGLAAHPPKAAGAPR